ncbi:TLDc domain-containing protein [Entamoeba marina]
MKRQNFNTNPFKKFKVDLDVNDQLINNTEILCQYKNLYNNVIQSLKQWSGLNTMNILFDSDVDGNGSNQTLLKAVQNKSNMYFIINDSFGNVFGGYVCKNIGQLTFVKDSNCFVFSLIRTFQMKNKKYNLNDSKFDHSSAFQICHDNYFLFSFGFGDDIIVSPLNEPYSFCNTSSFNYCGEHDPFVDSNKGFTIERLIVVMMS